MWNPFFLMPWLLDEGQIVVEKLMPFVLGRKIHSY